MDAKKVDVLEVMKRSCNVSRLTAEAHPESRFLRAYADDAVEARAVVAELIEAVRFLMPRIEQTKGCVCIDRMHEAMQRVGAPA